MCPHMILFLAVGVVVLFCDFTVLENPSTEKLNNARENTLRASCYKNVLKLHARKTSYHI
jgi:hypothetical protein